MNGCFFIGHRDAPESAFPPLARAVEELAAQGVEEFFVGHYGSFDRMAARAVLAVKARYPQAQLTLLLPYHPAEQAVALPPGFDGSLYPPGLEGVPRRYAIPRANRWMVEQCAHLVAYVSYPASNASKLAAWGKSLGKAVVNLGSLPL